MQFFRKLLVAFSAGVLFFALIGMAWSHIASRTVLERDVVKDWLNQSGFYDNASQAVLEAANKETQERPDTSQNELPLDDPKVQSIAKEAFNPAYLKENVEKVLDGFYAWIDGSADNLNFAIDLAPAKQKLADGLSDYAVDRASTLPACTAEETAALGSDVDVLQATCLPPGVDPNVLAAQLKNEILNSGDFLGDTQFTASDLKVNENGNEVAFDEWQNAQAAQSLFSLAKMTPVILAIVSALAILAIVFLSSTRLAGINRASIPFVTAGFVLGISYLVLSRSSSWAEQAAKDAAGDTNAAQEIASGMLNSVFDDVGSLLLWYAVGFVVVGVAGVVTSYILGRKTRAAKPGKNQDDINSPEPPTNDSAKSADPIEKPEDAKKPAAPKPPRKIQL